MGLELGKKIKKLGERKSITAIKDKVARVKNGIKRVLGKVAAVKTLLKKVPQVLREIPMQIKKMDLKEVIGLKPPSTGKLRFKKVEKPVFLCSETKCEPQIYYLKNYKLKRRRLVAHRKWQRVAKAQMCLAGEKGSVVVSIHKQAVRLREGVYSHQRAPTCNVTFLVRGS